MRRIVLTFGLIAGAILSLMMLVSTALADQIGFGKAFSAIGGFTTMVLSFLLVYFGIRTFRDTMTDGTIGFGKAFGVGLLITLVACVCYVATWEVIYYWLMPDFLERYAAHALATARASGATEAELAAQARELARHRTMYANPLVNVAFAFIEPLPVGIVMTAVSAWLLRRRQPRSGTLAVGATSPAL
ncbi:MAG TPA: DUF4199 domain-containing protein [Gemmatimonadaceae bacterium]|nr:DUF4199 domain-containing protein [Gemmatimonadaceae bacterium]